jgi:hypothetical protein
LGLLTPAAAGILAATESLSQALNPAHALKLVRANLGSYVVLLVLLAVVGPLAGFVGTLACVVGIFVASAYVTAVTGHLVGQAYLKARASAPSA